MLSGPSQWLQSGNAVDNDYLVRDNAVTPFPSQHYWRALFRLLDAKIDLWVNKVFLVDSGNGFKWKIILSLLDINIV
jgi:hypothetical protein